MLSIGAFSKLGHISIRMLRHYDAIGLLRPAHVDEHTGYRHYDWQQLERLGKIELLKSYRFSLARITELLQADPATFQAALHEKRLSLFAELAQLQSLTRRLDEHIGQMEVRPLSQQAYKVLIMEAQPQRIFGLTRHIHIGQVHELFQEVRAEMESRGLTPAGAALFFFHGDSFNYADMNVEAAFPVSQAHPDTRVMRGGPYISTTHHGRYDRIQAAYEAIAKWLSEHPEYEIDGSSVERYLRDENDHVPPEEFETCILFPVRRLDA